MRNGKSILVFAMILGLMSGTCAYSQEIELSTQAQDNTQTQKIKANKDTLNKAQEAINNKDFQTAIILMTSYINSKPKRYEAYKLRGDAYYALRRYDLAQKDYQTAVDIKTQDDKMATNTKYISAIILGADKYEQLQNTELGDLYGALMYAQKAQNDPEYKTSYENAIKYNSHIFLPEPKKQDINKINCPQKYGKILNPQGIDVNIQGAIDDIEQENYNEALYKLQDVTVQYPNYYLGHYLSGVALAGLEKDDDAIKSFETSIKLNPYDFESYASLGQIYYRKAETTFNENDSKKSIEYFNKALQLNKNCPAYYFYIGMNKLQNGENDEAISNFNKALKINSTDYNSMYYKLIAQFINGDYQSVVDGTTKLLYRHVSNYNSVMYLRALAYTRLNETQKALQDLDTIENNIEDIYNTDIKTVSAKEKSLENYIHYLKSEIQHSLGAGAASDKAQSYNNPIINRLANAQKAIAPYEKSLSGETISPSAYKRFEYFYSTSLPKLLNSGAVITLEDIDNQYDYIRTTFDNLGISFVYTSPYYKITTINDYPAKKYGKKINIGGNSNPQMEQFSTQTINMPQSAAKSDIIGNEGESSLAKILASNELADRVKEQTPPQTKIKTEAPAQEVKEDILKAEFTPETPDGESVNSSKNIAGGGQYTGTPLVDDTNSQKVKTILEEEKSMDNHPIALRGTEPQTSKAAPAEPKVQQTTPDKSIKIYAKEIKETPDVVIKHEKSDPIVTTTEIDNSKTAELTKTATSGVILTASDKINNEEKKLAQEPVKEPTKKIAQKYAKVDPKNFDVKTPQPKIEHNSEVVELKLDDNKNKFSDSDLFTKDETGATVAKAIPEPTEIVEQKSIQQKEPSAKDIEVSKPVTLPEEQPAKTVQAETKTETPVVTVPQIDIKQQSTEPKDKQIIEQSKEHEPQIPDAEISSQIPAKTETSGEERIKEQLSEVMDNIFPKTEPETAKQESEESSTTEITPEEKLTQAQNQVQTLKEERLKLKEQAKLAKQQAKVQAKAQKQEAKEAAKLAKEQAKAQKQQMKEEAKLAKEQVKAAKDQQEELAKDANIVQEQAQKTVREQKELSQETDELKVQRIIDQQQANAQEQTAEQKKALKEQLKAERKKAKEEYKARKAAQNLGKKTLLSKLKFWDK